MLKKFLSISLVFLVIAGLIPAGICSAEGELPAPVVISARYEGTDFIVTWKNPASVVELAKSAYTS